MLSSNIIVHWCSACKLALISGLINLQATMMKQHMDLGLLEGALWLNSVSRPTGRAQEILPTITRLLFFGRMCVIPFSIRSKMVKAWSNFLLPFAPVHQACAQQQAACIVLRASCFSVLHTALTRPKLRSLSIWTLQGQTGILHWYVVLQQPPLAVTDLCSSDCHPSLREYLGTAEFTL